MIHQSRLPIICSLMLLIFFAACHKQDTLSKSNPINEAEARAWLQQNGLAYKKETITVKNATGQLITGKLNWQKAQQYPWKGNDYLDVPFEFAGYGAKTPGDNEIAGASFNLVIRSKGGSSFEGAVRTTVYDTKAENLSISGENSLEVQSYQAITGEKLNVWQKNEGNAEFQAGALMEFTDQQVTQMRKQAIIRKNNTGTFNRSTEACTIFSYTSYETRCFANDPNADPHNVTPLTCNTIRITHFHMVCTPASTLENGSEYPPGGGGSTQPDGPEKKDPCEEARKKAAELKKAMEEPKVKSRLQELITKHKNAANEHGFIIYKKADGTYDVTGITTTNSNNSLGFTYDASLNVIAMVHTHPPGGSAIQSSTDIYGLSDHMSNPDFVGSIVTSGDNVNLLSINNLDQYKNFLAVSDAKGFYDKDADFGWREGTFLHKEFTRVKDDFLKLHMDGSDAVLPSQLYLMQFLNLGKLNGVRMGTGMGLSFQKYDMNANTVTPQKTVASPKMGTGAGSTMSPGGQNITPQYYASIDIEEDCKD